MEPADDDTTRSGAGRTELKTFEERAGALRHNESKTDPRLDALATEASMGGRLTVVSNGDRPMTALLDNRAKAAALGGLVGMALPVGLMVIRAARRRCYRFCDEVAADLLDRVPLLAGLPDVSEADALG